jgi:outer membrane protein assembly factor BamB
MKHIVIPKRLLAVLLLPGLFPLSAADWPSWRGPEATGVSRETGLPGRWSPAGENLVWKAPHGGRSTPVVMDGRVYILNRAGDGMTEEERVMCFAAADGKLLWEHRFPIFLTDIPSNRVGWSSPAGDPETGNVYVYGVQNLLICLDRDGKVVWERSLHEECGIISGYGGRTPSPCVDGDLVIIGFLNSSWGTHGRGGHRYVALDKRTGEIVWWAEPGGRPNDTTYSVPIVQVIGGVRLLIDAGADGAVHAMKVRTGEKVWDFRMSTRGINPSVVYGNGKVFACHGEESLDTPVLGRVVAIDPTGKGDVTASHEKWRIDGIEAGYSSPAFHEGKLYVADNSANVHAIDAESGKVLWKHSVGTVMKASPVVADGKIYIGEVTARFSILKPGETSCETLSDVTFPTPDGTIIEVNGSAAVAGGRVFFVNRDELFAIGEKPWKGSPAVIPPAPAEEPPPAGEPATHLQVRPADVVLSPGSSAAFQARLFDAKGRFLRTVTPAWTLKGVKGTIDAAGKLVLAAAPPFAAGAVEARFESLAGEARVRVVPEIPFKLDFEDLEPGKPPPGWIGAGAKFEVLAFEGGKVLRKISNDFRFGDAETFFGRPEWTGYTIAADVRGTETRRNMPNITLLSSRYQLVLMGNVQKLKIISWLGGRAPSGASLPMPRLDRTIPFAWKPATWYRMKFRVDFAGGKGVARAKVWPRAEAEPGEWTIEVEDPVPNGRGSPGLQAYTAGITARSPGAEIYFDNLEVTRN